MAAGIASFWGWRGSFITLAIPTIIFGIAFYLLIGNVFVKKKDPAAKKVEDKGGAPGWVRPMVLFLVVASLVSSLSMSASSFLSVFAVKQLGTSTAVAAILVAVLSSSGLWASPFGGHICDRIGYVPTMLLSCVALGPFIFLATITPYGAGFIIVLLIWGALNSIRLPAVETYIVSQASPKRRSTILGIYYATSQHSTGILAPLLGYFFDHAGYIPVLQIVAGVILVVTLAVGGFLWVVNRRVLHPETSG
jgi:predicted MFS family arabinose efflux permease